MTVKADSKGRLTGARPGASYLRTELPGGTIAYVPADPGTIAGFKNPPVQEVKDVSIEEAEAFFGTPMKSISAEPMEVYMGVAEKGYLANGIVFQRFHLDENGKRAQEDGVLKKTSVLLRIKKAEE